MEAIRIGFETRDQTTVFITPNDIPLTHQSILVSWDGRQGRVLFENWESTARAKLVDLDADGISEVLHLENFDCQEPLNEHVYVYDPDLTAFRLDPSWKTFEYEYDLDPAALTRRIIETESERGIRDSMLLRAFAALMPRQVAAYLYRPVLSFFWDYPPPRDIGYLYWTDSSGHRMAFCGASDGTAHSCLAIMEEKTGVWQRVWSQEVPIGLPMLAVDTLRLGVESGGSPTLIARSSEMPDLNDDNFLIGWNGERARMLLGEPLKGRLVGRDLDGDDVLEVYGEFIDGASDTWRRGVVYKYDPGDSLYHPVPDSTD